MADKTASTSTSSSEKEVNQNLLLGIDLGTTSVKITLLDSMSRKVLLTLKGDSNASILSDHCIPHKHSEQDVCLIFKALNRTLSRVPEKLMRRVQRIGICGQMHGCVFWKKDLENFSIEIFNDRFEGEYCNFISHLFTWEDQRCSTTFLDSLPTSKNSLSLSTGFGCATIFWFARNSPYFLSLYDCAGTVQDLLVSVLCSMYKPVMSTQNAFSWGYFDIDQEAWENDMLQHAGFPVHLLPKVCKPGTTAGELPREYLGIPAGTEIGVALGDLQCSVLASLEHTTDAVLNVGTSSQMAVIIPTQKVCSHKAVLPSICIWPFFENKVVAVAASLTGGNAFATFVIMLQNWMKELQISTTLSKQELYDKLLECASGKTNTTLNIRPTLCGERHCTNLTGCVSGLNESNITLGDVTASLCNGIITNLQSLMPKEWLISCGVQRIVGTGNALAHNKILQKQTEKVWELPLVMRENTDASHGAALALV